MPAIPASPSRSFRPFRSKATATTQTTCNLREDPRALVDFRVRRRARRCCRLESLEFQIGTQIFSGAKMRAFISKNYLTLICSAGLGAFAMCVYSDVWAAANEASNANTAKKGQVVKIPDQGLAPLRMLQSLYPFGTPDNCPTAKIDIWIYNGNLGVSTFFGSRGKSNVMDGKQMTGGYSMNVGPEGCRYKITIERE